MAKASPSKRGSVDEADAGKIEELSFDEIRALEQEFVELTQGKVKQELETVRKRREEDELLGRKKSVDKVDLSGIQTEFAPKKGGLPDYLANLPEGHPLRARFEQGYRRRPDGTWFKAVPELEAHTRQVAGPAKKNTFYVTIGLAVCIVTVLIGIKIYIKALENKRAIVIENFKKKGFKLDNPAIRSKYQLILVTNWLPDLERLLQAVEKLPRNYDVFPDNPEPGSYLKHIRKQKLPFNESDALDWYSKNIRKPDWVRKTVEEEEAEEVLHEVTQEIFLEQQQQPQ